MDDPRKPRFAWLREPLVHFALLGVALFAAFQGFGDPPDAGRSIRIDAQALQRFLRSSGIPVPADDPLGFLETLTPSERRELVDQMVREEVLVREARAMALDADDAVIRRRLVDRLRTLQEEITSAGIEPADEELQEFFAAHRERYRLGATITFAHVFFDNRKAGRPAARQRAQRLRDSLATRNVPFLEAHRLGDPYLYQPNYVQRSPALVADHFSPALAASLFALPLDPPAWRGPLESPYGQHLVWIADRTEDHLPELDEVRERVLRDLRRQLVRRATDRAIDELVERYRVDVDLPIPLSGD